MLNDSILDMFSSNEFDKFIPAIKMSAWQPKSKTNKIAKQYQDAFAHLTGHHPDYYVVPGGVEVVDISNKNSRYGANCVSIGPNILQPHSINERVEIKSIDRF